MQASWSTDQLTEAEHHAVADRGFDHDASRQVAAPQRVQRYARHTQQVHQADAAVGVRVAVDGDARAFARQRGEVGAMQDRAAGARWRTATAGT